MSTQPSERALKLAAALAPHIDIYFQLNHDWKEQVATIIDAHFPLPAISAAELDEVQAYCDAATEGPWWGNALLTPWPDNAAYPQDVTAPDGSTVFFHRNWKELCANVRLAIKARTDLPRLVQALRGGAQLAGDDESQELRKLCLCGFADLFAADMTALRTLWNEHIPEADLEKIANGLGYSFD